MRNSTNPKTLLSIKFNEYVRNLTDHLLSSYRVNSEAIVTKIDVDDVSLDIDAAIPSGLIINDLVSNSLKYAFPDGREGEIRINLSSNDKKHTLMVGDNGVGFPKDTDFRNTESLGLELVNMLVEKLKGSIELETGDGTTFVVTFLKN